MPTDPEIRQAAADLLTGAVAEDEPRYLAGVLGLASGMELTREQVNELGVRLTAVSTLAAVMIRGMVPPGARYDLPKMIELATDQATANDILAGVFDRDRPDRQ
jgi:hypothetical protein